jgi:hypothetical protein
MLQWHIEVTKIINQEASGLSVSDIANIIIAFCSLLLTGYIFIYQRTKDKKADIATANLNNQNLKLQWFKDLIIQPHLEILNKTFKTILDHPSLSISPTSADYSTKSDDYIKFTKTELYSLRKNFLSLFLTVNNQFYDNAIIIIDKHIDDITKALIDDLADLSNDYLYESVLIQKVISTRNSLIKLIYNFKGL